MGVTHLYRWFKKSVKNWVILKHKNGNMAIFFD